jgi:hypothetical protein
MGYKYELHAHTAEVSSCGHVAAAEAVGMYKQAGYQGIVFTDHFNEEYFGRLGNMSWTEMIDRYLAGYHAAVEEAVKVDMDVLWGLELRFTGNGNDYLVYGMEEAFLKSLEFLHRSDIREFMEIIADNPQILVYQAHPFRDGCSLINPLIVHGLEIYNGNPRHDSRNQLAAEVALENNMLILSGSDFHRPGDLATGGVILSERFSSNEDFIKQLRGLQCESLISEERVCR